MASPVEAIADSLDEEAAVDGKGGGKLASAIRGEFGEYDFDDAQLQVRLSAEMHEHHVATHHHAASMVLPRLHMYLTHLPGNRMTPTCFPATPVMSSIQCAAGDRQAGDGHPRLRSCVWRRGDA